jgi:flagellar hook-associated protein FlgK
MSSISSISLSGLNAAQTGLQVSAQNIANLNTQGLQRQEATQSTLVGGGASAEIRLTESTSANLEADMVQQLQAKNIFLANLSVFKASNSTLGFLLDTKA